MGEVFTVFTRQASYTPVPGTGRSAGVGARSSDAPPGGKYKAQKCFLASGETCPKRVENFSSPPAKKVAPFASGELARYAPIPLDPSADAHQRVLPSSAARIYGKMYCRKE